MAPLQGSGRNVLMDNFFTSVPVARTLLQHHLTVVGIVKKCKRESPVCMKAAKSQQRKTSVLGFINQLTKKTQKRGRRFIKFYNETKVGVDLVDQMVQTYTWKRQTCRWPLILFYNVLDIAALNANTVFQQVYPDYLSGYYSWRRCFKTDLAESLIMPHTMTTQKIPQLHKVTKEAMIQCGLGLSSTS